MIFTNDHHKFTAFSVVIKFDRNKIFRRQERAMCTQYVHLEFSRKKSYGPELANDCSFPSLSHNHRICFPFRSPILRFRSTCLSKRTNSLKRNREKYKSTNSKNSRCRGSPTLLAHDNHKYQLRIIIFGITCTNKYSVIKVS